MPAREYGGYVSRMNNACNNFRKEYTSVGAQPTLSSRDTSIHYNAGVNEAM